MFLDSTSVALVQDFAPVALGQDVTDTARDKQLMSGLRLAYDLGYADSAAESA